MGRRETGRGNDGRYGRWDGHPGVYDSQMSSLRRRGISLGAGIWELPSGKKYEEQYEKISRYVLEHKERKILFLELGVGRMTPMFIQEPFWNLTLSFPHARYIAVNDKYDFLPKQLENRGMAIVADIGKVLRDGRAVMSEEKEEINCD